MKSPLEKYMAPNQSHHHSILKQLRFSEIDFYSARKPAGMTAQLIR